MADEPQSLRSCFAHAETKRKALENTYDSNSDVYQENLISAITSYEECVRVAAEVSLFSTNESVEDISSSDLQYLLLHFHLASLLFKTRGDRKAILIRARTELEKYLKGLDNYDILSKEETKLYEHYQERPDSFSTASTTDAAARRQTKISRFKEEKALKGKLEYLQRNPSLLSTDDDAIRSLHLTNLSLSTHRAFADLESIAQELQILSLAPPPPPPGSLQNGTNGHAPDDRTRHDRGSDTYSDRLDTNLSSLLNSARNGGPILSTSGRPLRPFTLLDTRQRLQQGVFRPDHNLPTMTIDEYLEEEAKRGGIVQGGPESGRRAEVDEDDDRAMDAATMKARAWDDFKDDNPRGAGNTMNMG